MFEVRLHGRGGQGVVTAADLLALAAFEEGQHAESFPSFGSERTGAPVVAYCRWSERDIRTREPVVAPDCVIVIDPTLVHQVDLFVGLRPDGFVLVNSTKTMDGLGLGPLLNKLTRPICSPLPQPKSHYAKSAGRCPTRPIGGFAALTGKVAIGAVGAAIRERFRKDSSLAERNVAAATEMYHYTRQVMVLSGQAMLGVAAD